MKLLRNCERGGATDGRETEMLAECAEDLVREFVVDKTTCAFTRLQV